LYNSDGSVGASLGAGIGVGVFKNAKEAFAGLKPLSLVEPRLVSEYEGLYRKWKSKLDLFLK